MARSLTNAKLISAFVVEKICVVGTRRGYAAAAGASQGGVSTNARSNMNVLLKKGGEEESTKTTTTTTTSWVPDPVTGYYRPEGVANEIDAAELRNMLLNHKN